MPPTKVTLLRALAIVLGGLLVITACAVINIVFFYGLLVEKTKELSANEITSICSEFKKGVGAQEVFGRIGVSPDFSEPLRADGEAQDSVCYFYDRGIVSVRLVFDRNNKFVRYYATKR